MFSFGSWKSLLCFLAVHTVNGISPHQMSKRHGETDGNHQFLGVLWCLTEAVVVSVTKAGWKTTWMQETQTVSVATWSSWLFITAVGKQSERKASCFVLLVVLTILWQIVKLWSSMACYQEIHHQISTWQENISDSVTATSVNAFKASIVLFSNHLNRGQSQAVDVGYPSMAALNHPRHET